VRRWTEQTTEGTRWLRTVGRENRGGNGAFALLERGNHIAPLRLDGSRFAVNAFVPPNRSRVQNSSTRRGRRVRAWFTGAATPRMSKKDDGIAIFFIPSTSSPRVVSLQSRRSGRSGRAASQTRLETCSISGRRLAIAPGMIRKRGGVLARSRSLFWSPAFRTILFPLYHRPRSAIYRDATRDFFLRGER